MPGATTRGFPFPLTSDPFLPASVDFPALAAAIESKTAREVATVLSAAGVLDVGVAGQVRAGRELAVADFTTLCGLPVTPVGLWDAGSLTNLGSGGNLTNKGAVPLTAKGINGTANHAALFAGSTGQALYIADVGAGDPFRITTGSWGCWFRTAKRGTQQMLIAKGGMFQLYVESDNVAHVGSASFALSAAGSAVVTDDRWHFAVGTCDGSVCRLYVDGSLQASTEGAPLAATAEPLNIGNYNADGSTNGTNPHFGRIAAPFVTSDVLSVDQVRLLMAAKVAHGYTGSPTRAHVGVRRKRRGPALATSDFTVTPKRLHNLGGGAGDNDLGSNATNFAANTAANVAGPDGATLGAGQFNGTSSAATSTDAGLPATTTARTVGAWFKTSAAAVGMLVQYGTSAGDANFALYMNANGTLTGGDGGANIATSAGSFNDGRWHFGVVVYDPAAADGLKVKVYVDGRLVASSTATITSTTLAGANAFRVGENLAGANFFAGSLARVFVTDYAMAADEVGSLNAKGGQALPVKPGDDPLDAIVQGFDATNVYVLGDVRKRVSGRVTSTGAVVESLGGDLAVVKGATGAYTVYFPPGMFSAPPQIVATTLDSGERTAYATDVSARSATINVYGGGGAIDEPFMFTAEGRGPLDPQDALDLRVAA